MEFVIRLMREVRFFTAPCDLHRGAGSVNTWAGTGASSDPPYWVVRMVVEGPAHERTGYVCDIKILDDFVRNHVAPALAGSLPSFDGAARIVGDAVQQVAEGLPAPLRLISIQLRFSPGTFLTIQKEANAMLLTQSYEFSASHRLACAGLSDEENRQLFGKCSNPHGHGHNYVLEVTIDIQSDAPGATLTVLDRVVQAEIIQPFDHKNLNVECAEFRDLNPTVENIAQVIFDRLAPGISPLRLASVRVWETPKTYAECTGFRTQEHR